ncbi:MAG: SDR family NAD(P)-dependent oxidoreductase [Alphaproteobacteria bacterium]|nr:SDR family NAD(P)-dependent oxidoreductase [Alphaproteobacteria bacterium]
MLAYSAIRILRGRTMHRLIFVSLVLLATLPAGSNAASTADPKQKAILVTGASTGIGRKITERLAAHGYLVYAGARKESDLQALGALANVRAVRLDVTKPEDIAAAVEFVTKGGLGLYGLVNNAGIYTDAPVIDTSPEEFDLVMKVNVYGPYRMAKAFAPMIKASRGRIVNIGSISGILNETGSGAYQMSKHAMETFSATMAQELAPAGVLVSIVEPGSYKSEIVRNTITRSGTLTQKDLEDWAKLKEPDDVAAAVESALSEPRPKLRYMVVPEAEQAQDTIKAQIEQLVQLNEGQPYTYDRAALIKMLDAALAGARPRSN